MNVLWVTDAWDTLDHPRDTTLRLVEEAVGLGRIASWWCDPSGLRCESGRVIARCRRVAGAPPGRAAAGWRLEDARDVELGGFDQVHYRVDPPVDGRYWEHLQLLVRASAGGRPEIVNPPDVVALHGDKLGPPALARALPPSVVSSSWECLDAFGRAERRAVLKPLGGAQSRGVQLLDWSAPGGAASARRAIEELSGGLARPVLLQRFLPEVYTGEKRLWFVDGALLAYARKRPREGTFVVDMDKGASCEPCDLAPAEERLARAVGDAFQSQRVRLAAVDVIGGYVTDWNVTSPGMIPTMERVLGRNLARSIVEALGREGAAHARPGPVRAAARPPRAA